jgi:CHAD domain-containing protein
VYQSGCRQRELQHGKKKMEGIVHYVRMRHDSARAQLKRLRRTMNLFHPDLGVPSHMA